MDHLALSDAALTRMLEDDAPCGDLTTSALAIGAQPARLRFHARAAMTLCAIEEAARLFALAGARPSLSSASGQALAPGALLMTVEGAAAQLHLAWKAAQVLVEWASGIATATAAIVAAGGALPVACTRKNVPGTKAMSVKAVRAGGATMHRLGLSETVLLFPEHRLFLAQAPQQTVKQLRRREPEKKLVVEVADGAEALIWALAGADILQLEKFTPAQVAACRAAIDGHGLRTLLAAAGGVHAGNAADYAAAGADLLVTSAPYSAAPRDVQVCFIPG